MAVIMATQFFDKIDQDGEMRCYVLRILESKKTAV